MIGGVKAEVPTQALFGLVTLHAGFDNPNEEKASAGGILYRNNWVITAIDIDNGNDIQVLFTENLAHQQIVKNVPANVRRLNHGLNDDGFFMVKLPGPFFRGSDPVVSRAVLNRDRAAPVVGQSLQVFGRGHSQFGPSGEPDDVVGPKIWHGENFTVTSTDPAHEVFEVTHGQFGALLVAGDSGGPFFSDEGFVFFGNHQRSEWSNSKPSRPVFAEQLLVAPYADEIDRIANE